MDKDIRKQYFPMSLPLDVIGLCLDRTSAEKYIQAINHQIFPPGFKQKLGLFETPDERQETQKNLSKQHSRSASEWIIFLSKNDQPIGWFYGYMEDGETFFIDTIGLIPEYRRAGVYTAFLVQLLAYLRAKGYERVTTSHHPNNRAALIADLKTGFNIVGMELHESHGVLVKMAHSLHEDRRSAFEQVFSVKVEEENE